MTNDMPSPREVLILAALLIATGALGAFFQ